MTVGTAQLLSELSDRGVRVERVADRLRLSPRSAVTPEIAERVRRHKPELLDVLADSTSRETPPPSSETPTASARNQQAGRPIRGIELVARHDVEAEIARFLRVCRPYPDGSGWYDPTAMDPATRHVLAVSRSLPPLPGCDVKSQRCDLTSLRP